ncbi:SdrD B-like domain-containing protein [Microbacterium aquimaris]|uniref:SdrD B-like domain-containing protein n=1 Tax=Microbacterium aquimaris TaxID=459816 RepID=UPI002AD43E23|nr:SdrD B-like domain-containing protein [Microbacterium aquimaris]MDZ8274727.1 SdrD B-like domain-containing protein [Microbacterium aquimaris]
MSHDRTRRATFMSVIAALLAALLAMTGVIPATAAEAGAIKVTLNPGGTDQYGENTVVTTGVDYTLNIQYDSTKLTDGQQIVIGVPDGVTIPDSALVIPAGNTVLDSITRLPDGSLQLTVDDPRDPSINQGLWGLTFRLDEVQTSSIEQLTWTVDAETTDLTVIVKQPGDEFEDVVDARDKSVGAHNLNGLVSVSDGTVAISDAALQSDIPYTVSIDTTEAVDGLTISDAIDPRLAIEAGSFAAELTTWDDNGLNKTTIPFAISPDVTAAGFSAVVDLPANSELRLTYTARIADAAALASIRDTLQEGYDAVELDGGTYKTTFTNTVTYSDTGATSAASTTVQKSVAAPAQPNRGAAFRKDVDVTQVKPFTPVDPTDTGADLAAPQDVTYTIRTDLTRFADFAGERFGLTSNVVVKDTLPNQAEWLTGEADFFSAATSDGTPVVFTEATGLSGDLATAIAGDAYVGQYVVDGQILYVNVGKDTGTYYNLSVRARIVDLQGTNPSTDSEGLTSYTVRNTAQFIWSDDTQTRTHTNRANTTFVDLGDPSDPRTSDDVFTKRTGDDDLTVAPGETLTIPYIFTVAQGQAIAAESRIVDFADTNVFDLSDLDAIEADIEVIYNNGAVNTIGSTTLDATFWNLTRDDDGALEFAFTDAFAAAISAAGLADDRKLEVYIPLTTKPVVGKQSLEITNNAQLIGASNGLVYTSEQVIEATSYGDELEVAKTVYNADTDTWTQNLRVGVDDGQLAADSFIYRIRVIPHGSYGTAGVSIAEILDVLPAEVSFDGFVAADDVDSGTVTAGDSFTLPGNLVATQSEVDGRDVVTIANRDGTVLNTSDAIDLHVKVSVDSFTEDVGIINEIGGTSATITPTNAYPLSILKIDTDDQTVAITDRDARFEILDADGAAVVDDAYVVDGRLMVPGEDGGDKAVTVPEPGTYTLVEMRAPFGYLRDDESVRITVEADGAVETVRFYNEPSDVPTVVSVGDYVWYDADGDGVQGTSADEEPIEGVTLTITGPDGEPVVDGAGEPLTTVTDENGFYEFTDLPILETGQSYTVSIDRDDAGTIAALEGLMPTTPGAGDDTAADSSDWIAESTELTEPGDRDPTLDFGFVDLTYAIGDVVWIDENRDGVQDDTELPLEGVTVTLLDADGEPLDGVDPVVTDADGRYVFDELVAGEYRVQFTLTEEQSLIYGFTAADVDAGAAGADSDAAVATGVTGVISLDADNTELTSSYADQAFTATEGIDPTWDAGVVRKKVAVSDYVWLDIDGDGIQGSSPDEKPLPGVVLVITGPDGQPVTDLDGETVGPQTTDEDGLYLFDNLPALPEGESYTVTIDRDDPSTVEALSELRPTPAGEGDDPTRDSNDWSAESGDLVEDGAIDPTLDFGFMPRTYAIGDVVWIDENRDGVQDDTELPLEGVTVTLLDADGEPLDGVDPVVTDADGRYLFDVLAPGEYRVRFTLTEEQQHLYTFTTADTAAGALGADSDAAVETGTTGVIVLGEDNTELDLDYADQAFEATEGVDPTWDAGVIRKQVSVGDYVWLDEDGDGVQGTSDAETPIAGVKLVLTGPDGEAVTDIDGDAVEPVYTDENGFYEFTRLPALADGESYTVTIDQDDASTIEALTELRPTLVNAGGDAALDSSEWVAVSGDLVDNDARDATLDFGFIHRTYAVGDVVWIDSDKDGVQDDSEHTLDGVIVRLFDGDGMLVDYTTTDENGLYLFDDLRAGDYTVQFELTDAQQEMYEFTSSLSGDDVAGDSDADVTTGLTATITLGEGNTALTSDYPYAVVSATEGIDPTWDAGVIELPAAPEPATPTLGSLPRTGGDAPLGLLFGGIALIGLGLIVVGAFRRRAEV